MLAPAHLNMQTKTMTVSFDLEVTDLTSQKEVLEYAELMLGKLPKPYGSFYSIKVVDHSREVPPKKTKHQYGILNSLPNSRLIVEGVD